MDEKTIGKLPGDANKQSVNPLANLVKINQFQVQSYNTPAIGVAALANDSKDYNFSCTFKPDYWVVMARCSAGYVVVYPSNGHGPIAFRMDRGTLVLPVRTDTLTVQTVGVNGFFDVYAAHDLDGLVLEA